MCGFAGIVQVGGGVDRARIEAMGASLVHRGPDQQGVYLRAEPPLGVGLASCRLAIIDLTAAGDQPMPDDDGETRIAYNGELYNDAELRATLERRGCAFRSRTDTETVLKWYAEEGTDGLPALNGMFAFAIADHRRGRVVLARDRMGIKPLYYVWDGRRLVFASELRTLLGAGGMPFAVDSAGLERYLALGYVPSPHSLVRGIRKLPPGAFLSLEATGELRIEEFWRPRPAVVPRTRQDAIYAVRETVRDAVRRQSRSDVPVGILLSGGLDSTIVASVAASLTSEPINTFTVSFAGSEALVDDSFNLDGRFARRVAMDLGSRHHDIVLDDGGELANLLPRLVVGLDEPAWEPSFISIYFIARLAHEHGVKVLLTGDGSDELFLGYPWHVAAWRQEKYEGAPFLRSLAGAVTRLAPANSLLYAYATNMLEVVGVPDEIRHEHYHQVFSPAERRDLLGAPLAPSTATALDVLPDASGRRLADRLAVLDLLLWVREHFNQRIDRMTMLNSVEARVPFQDNTVVDLALSLDTDTKAPRGRPKAVLRDAFRRDVPEFVTSRPKRPFAAPMNAWMSGALRPLIEELLEPGRLAESGIVDPAVASSLIGSVKARRDPRHGRLAWSLAILHLWAAGMRGLTDRATAPVPSALAGRRCYSAPKGEPPATGRGDAPG